uniref:E3 SUMO-protein ligase NSE2 n=2 Tax=Drosophila melanogaster TaxID=7227 RepID=Q9VXT4_DROME|eukprot:NP_727866.2 uncharacterized protein Dmel_CG42299 [Drosophila melanogaster]
MIKMDPKSHQKLFREMAEVVSNSSDDGEKLLTKNSSNTIEKSEEVCKERPEAVEQMRIDVNNSLEDTNYMNAVESEAQKNIAGLDEDLIMEDFGVEVVPFHDPWSKLLIKHPVRNKRCGHIYDRETVLMIIKDNIGILCPVRDCPNLSDIKLEHLVKDPDVEQELQKRKSDKIKNETSSDED